MIRALAPVAALLLGVAILLAGQGLQSILVPLRANLEEFSTIGIGLMGGAYFLGFTFGCLRGVKLVQKLGHVRVFAAMAAIASATPLILALFVNVWAWWLLRLISGFCFAILYVVIESWLNEKSSNENRGLVFSAYTFISMTLMAVGQQLLQFHDPAGLTLFAIASVLVSLAAVPVVMSTSTTPKHSDSVQLNIKRLFAISHTGAMVCLASGLANGAFWALAPVFTAGVSASVSTAATFMTAAVIGGAIGQWPLGFWSDRTDRRVVIAVLAILSASTGLTMGFVYDGLGVTTLILLSAAWGATAFPLYAIAVAHSNDYAESGEYVMVSSGLLLMYGIGAIVGPFLAGAAMTLFSKSSLYLYTTVIHLVIFIYVLTRIPRRAASPLDQHVPFSEALTAVQTASQIYEEEEQKAARR
ncbi:MAG: MFS transporter [Xanthomonadales bacterium]|nr:MFS transporter [Xanthomonadales bacterium]